MERDHAKMKPEATCFARAITAPGTDEIVQAVAVIPTDQGRFVVRACIIEELTQAMGLFNDSDKIEPSIFNDSSTNMMLTNHDRILLRLLYDKRLHPGMTWSRPNRSCARWSRNCAADVLSRRVGAARRASAREFP